MTFFKNPCIDTDYVTIVPAARLTDQTYITEDTKKTYDQQGYDGSTEVEDFVIATKPIGHSYCGALTYTAEFEGVVIDDADTPLSYEEDGTETFSIETSDSQYTNSTRAYSVTAEFANYPKDKNSGADQQEISGNIEFLDPCVNLFTFASSDQTDIADDNFSNTEKIFTLTKFDISPTSCINSVTYDCTSVIGPNEVDYTERMCGADNPLGQLDGVFNGDATDGQLKVSATTAEYLS